jgi:hypothetical protein
VYEDDYLVQDEDFLLKFHFDLLTIKKKIDKKNTKKN